MTPQEQQLIAQLFSRLKQAPAQAKDMAADALIERGLAEQPDAPYQLVQTVIIQDMALADAQSRLAELERQLAAAKSATPAQPASFLGSAAAPTGLGAAGPWGRLAPPPITAEPPAASPVWTQHGGGAAAAAASGPAAAGPMPGSSSSFLRAAAATALGVAGGQLLLQGVQSLFGHSISGLMAGAPMQPSISETVVNNYYGEPDTASPQSAGDDVPDRAPPDGASARDYDPGGDADPVDADFAGDADFGSDDLADT